MTIQDINVALFVRTFSEYGGAENMCYMLHHYLKKQGYGVRVFCGRNNTALRGETVTEVPVFRLSRFGKIYSYFRSASRLLEELPDNTISLSFAPLPGCDIYRSGGSHLDFVTKTLRAQPTAMHKCSKAFRRAINPVNYLVPHLDKKIYSDRRTRRIIAISRLMQEEIAGSYPTAVDKISIIPNGVDTRRFKHDNLNSWRQNARAHYGMREDAKIIGFCSTNLELKGLRHLIQALSVLPEEYRVLVAGGRRPEKYLKAARAAGVGDRVHFIGKVNDMPRFYAALDLFCHPSFYDTFGNVVAEALASGIPVVTSPYVGAGDLIKSGQNGFIVDPEDKNALAGAIQDTYNLGTGDYSAGVMDKNAPFKEYEKLIMQVAQEKLGATEHKTPQD
ncbi:MAG: glycosyltransferase family 4 protein [Desulfovibrio sp.]